MGCHVDEQKVFKVKVFKTKLYNYTMSHKSKLPHRRFVARDEYGYFEVVFDKCSFIQVIRHDDIPLPNEERRKKENDKRKWFEKVNGGRKVNDGLAKLLGDGSWHETEMFHAPIHMNTMVFKLNGSIKAVTHAHVICPQIRITTNAIKAFESKLKEQVYGSGIIGHNQHISAMRWILTSAFPFPNISNFCWNSKCTRNRDIPILSLEEQEELARRIAKKRKNKKEKRKAKRQQKMIEKLKNHEDPRWNKCGDHQIYNGYVVQEYVVHSKYDKIESMIDGKDERNGGKYGAKKAKKKIKINDKPMIDGKYKRNEGKAGDKKIKKKIKFNHRPMINRKYKRNEGKTGDKKIKKKIKFSDKQMIDGKYKRNGGKAGAKKAKKKIKFNDKPMIDGKYKRKEGNAGAKKAKKKIKYNDKERKRDKKEKRNKRKERKNKKKVKSKFAILCGGCFTAAYCCRACQKQDWHNHHATLCKAGRISKYHGTYCLAGVGLHLWD